MNMRLKYLCYGYLTLIDMNVYSCHKINIYFLYYQIIEKLY